MIEKKSNVLIPAAVWVYKYTANSHIRDLGKSNDRASSTEVWGEKKRKEQMEERKEEVKQEGNKEGRKDRWMDKLDDARMDKRKERNGMNEKGRK